MKKFNLRIFRVATAVAVLLTFISWVAIEANGMENGNHAVWGAISRLWSVLRFPIFTLYWHFLYNQNNLILFSIAVFLNCAFYGFIFERFYSLSRKKSKFPHYPTRV
jgi:hypothetical protein